MAGLDQVQNQRIQTASKFELALFSLGTAQVTGVVFVVTNLALAAFNRIKELFNTAQAQKHAYKAVEQSVENTDNAAQESQISNEKTEKRDANASKVHEYLRLAGFYALSIVPVAGSFIGKAVFFPSVKPEVVEV